MSCELDMFLFIQLFAAVHFLQICIGLIVFVCQYHYMQAAPQHLIFNVNYPFIFHRVCHEIIVNFLDTQANWESLVVHFSSVH